MRATTSGWEIVWPAPIGSGTLSHASAASASGTNSSRGTVAHRLQHALVGDVRAELIDQPVAAAASRHHAAGGAHLGQRALGVARLDLHAAHGGGVDRHLEARAQRVERGVLDAVVGREADDGDLVMPRSRSSVSRSVPAKPL